MARRLTLNSTDLITLSAGALDGSTRAGTLIVLVKRNDAFSLNFSIMSGRASGSATWGLLVDTSTPFANNDFVGPGITITLDNWTVIAVTKSSGSATYRYHVAEIGGSWTHQNGGTSDDGTASTSIEIGTAVNALRGVDIAAAARWATDVLSDTEIEALGTTDMADWLSATPDGAWQFNQASTSDDVTDLTGNGADQTAIVGTSVTDDPDGWTYFSGTEAAEGTADVGFGLDVSAAGSRDSSGTAGVGLTYTVAAVGDAPAVAAAEGTGNVGLAFTIAAAGSTTASGTADVGLAYSVAAGTGPVGTLVFRAAARPSVVFESTAEPRVMMEVSNA